MLHRHSMGNRRNRGHEGSLVRRLKRSQGNTWHKGRRWESRLREVHEAFTGDVLPHLFVPFAMTERSQALVGPIGSEA